MTMRTGAGVRRSIKASFLFFLAGVVAGGGVNLLTALVGSVDTTAIRFAKIWWGLYLMIASYFLSVVAGAKEDGEREIQASSLPSLTADERGELVTRILGEVNTAIRVPVTKTTAITIVWASVYGYVMCHLP